VLAAFNSLPLAEALGTHVSGNTGSGNAQHRRRDRELTGNCQSK
jgi:hypothetical protein